MSDRCYPPIAKLRGLSCKRYNRNSCQKPFLSRSKRSKDCWKGSLAITTEPPQRPSVSKAAAQRTLPLAADRINALQKPLCIRFVSRSSKNKKKTKRVKCFTPIFKPYYRHHELHVGMWTCFRPF